MAYQIDQELCSCCHRCRVECPTGAIRFRGSKYWIDPDTMRLLRPLCHRLPQRRDLRSPTTRPRRPPPTPRNR